MQEKALFADTFLVQQSMFKRLGREFAAASREFRQNPKGFIMGAVKGDGTGSRLRQERLMLGFAIAFTFFTVVVISMLIAFWISHSKAKAQDELAVEYVKLTDLTPQDIDMPKMEKKAGGGGGGGRNAPTPPSKGQAPKFSLTPPMIAPRPEPTPRPPALAVQETVQVDPRLEPPKIADMPIGDPKGVPGPPSPGPGSGGGIGTGKGGGIGSGDGTGLGPGTGFNTGGGGPSLGGGSNPNAPATAVDVKPIPLNSPSPRYTEEARKNKIQGTVRVRVLIGADGGVKQVRMVRGLPDGLEEEAIRAAYQLRFRPAMKGGQPVAFWVPVDIEFNLR
jgi:periplasmic protein TonB